MFGIGSEALGYGRIVDEAGEELSLLAKDEGLGFAVAVVVVEWDRECCCCYCHGGYERGEEEAHNFFLSFLFFLFCLVRLSSSSSILSFYLVSLARLFGVKWRVRICMYVDREGMRGSPRLSWLTTLLRSLVLIRRTPHFGINLCASIVNTQRRKAEFI